jgi:hypothetical protein
MLYDRGTNINLDTGGHCELLATQPPQGFSVAKSVGVRHGLTTLIQQSCTKFGGPALTLPVLHWILLFCKVIQRSYTWQQSQRSTERVGFEPITFTV